MNSILISTMRRTVKFILDLDVEQHRMLLSTIENAARVFNEHVDWAFENRSHNKYKAHTDLYHRLRKQYGINCSILQSTRDMALEAVKALKFKFKPRKALHSAIRFDSRTLKLRGQQLIISTDEERIRTVIQFPTWCKDMTSTWKQKGATIGYDDRTKCFVANICFEGPDVSPKQVGRVVGLDRGLINLVTTSDGVVYDAKKIRKNQRRYLYLRRRLSAKGTRSARRLRKLLGGKEQRFSREQNHIIAKELASDETVKTYVIENLEGISKQRRGRILNKLLSSWPFFQFEAFLRYKCAAKGIEVGVIDPRFTSQRCSKCGFVHKENRKRGVFRCKKCGFESHADVNAAVNIRDKWLSKSSAPWGRQGPVNDPNDRRQQLLPGCQDHMPRAVIG